MKYKPENKRPWIISIAGTQSVLDWAANLNLGKKQLDQILGLVSSFSDCLIYDEHNENLVTRDIVVTGHSLGGGLAQAFAYFLLKLTLVTWNAFGARELVQRYEPFNLVPVALLDAAHYYIEGDPISRIGSHLGPSFRLIPESETLRSILEIKKQINLHSIETVIQVALYRFGTLTGLDFASRKSPSRFNRLSYLTQFTGFLDGLPLFVFRLSEESYTRTLTDALMEISQQDVLDEASRQILRYLVNISSRHLLSLEERKKFRQLSYLLANAIEMALIKLNP